MHVPEIHCAAVAKVREILVGARRRQNSAIEIRWQACTVDAVKAAIIRAVLKALHGRCIPGEHACAIHAAQRGTNKNISVLEVVDGQKISRVPARWPNAKLRIIRKLRTPHIELIKIVSAS